MSDLANRNDVRLTIPALPRYVSIARAMAAALARISGFEKGKIGEIISAVGEACINAVQHAYQKDGVGYYTGADIDIRFMAYPTELTIVVRDMGIGFDPVFVQRYITRSDAERPDKVKMGLFIVTQMMDAVEIDSGIGRGTQVRMTKRLI